MNSINKKQVILKPVISEKSLGFYKNFKVTTFEVEKFSTKRDIKFAFEEMFGIKPVSIRTVRGRTEVSSRDRRTYRINVNRKEYKKAYIGIGDNKLDIFESIN